MRRAVPSFTVEVRRRPRLAATSISDAQSSESRSPQAGFDRELDRALAAAFGVKKADPSPTDVASSPKGRILPSLVPDEPLRRPLRDATLTTAESEPPSRTPKRRDQASKSPRNSGLSSAENAPLAERLSTKSRQTSNAQSDEGTGVSPRGATTAQSPVVELRLPPRAKAKRRDEIAISCDDRAKPLPVDQSSAIETDSLAPPLRGSTIVHLQVESEPSWLAMSSAMNSNPASVGSGDCSRRDEAPLAHAALGSRSPIRRGASRRDPHHGRVWPSAVQECADGVDHDKRTI